jgi:hypothetical protein
VSIDPLRALLAAGALALLLALSAAPSALAQKSLRGEAIVPNPEPFSLNSYNALQAAALIRRVGFLQRWDGRGMPETLAVERVETVHIGVDPEAVPARRNRYDLRVNGQALDWDVTYIEYDGRMVNLRLLFTYRNQHPPEGLEYFIPLDLSGREEQS